MPLQFRRGTESERLAIVPSSGEPIWTTDSKKLYIGDGSTTGGVEVGGGGSFTSTVATFTITDTLFARNIEPYNTSTIAIGGGTEPTGIQNIFVGYLAKNGSGQDNIFIGNQAGSTSINGNFNVAIGPYAMNALGSTPARTNTIAIGYSAGTGVMADNSIILSAGSVITGAEPVTDAPNSGFYVSPVRSTTSTQVLYYNTSTKEISYGPAPSGGSSYDQTLNTSSSVSFANLNVSGTGTVARLVGTTATFAEIQVTERFTLGPLVQPWFDDLVIQNEDTDGATIALRNINQSYGSMIQFQDSFAGGFNIRWKNHFGTDGTHYDSAAHFYTLSEGQKIIIGKTGDINIYAKSGAIDSDFKTMTPIIAITATTETVSFNGAVVMNAGLSVGDSNQSTVSLSNQTGTVTLDSWSTSTYRSAKYLINVSVGADIHLVEIMSGHAAGNTYKNEYGIITSDGELVSFSTDIDSGNFRLRGTSTSTFDIKIVKTLMKI